MAKTPRSELVLILAPIRRRLRWLDLWQRAQDTFWLPISIALVIQIIGRLIPLEALALLTFAPFLLWAGGVCAYELGKPFPMMRAAQRVDLALGLRERLSTALAFEGKNWDAANPLFVPLQRADALRVAAAIQPSSAFPLRWKSRSWRLNAALLLALALALFLPNPMESVLQQRAAVRQEAQRQAQAIEELRQQIAQQSTHSAPEQEQLLRQLEELAEKLRRNPGDFEQALADLSSLEKTLMTQQDSQAFGQYMLLESLARRLSALTKRPMDPQAQAAEALSQALADIAARAPKLDNASRQEMASQLAQMAAQSSMAGANDLAQSLSTLAQALQNGDAQTALQAAQRAQDATAQLQSQLDAQIAIQAVLNQLQNSRQALTQAARQTSTASGASQSGSAQSGSAQGTGTQPGSGGGARANTLPPFRGGQTRLRPPQGQTSAAAPSDLSSQVYAPWQRPATSGGQVFIPGQDSGQGSTQVIPGATNLPGTYNPALVPYSEVFYEYYNLASQTMQQNPIPSTLLWYVKNYFTQIAPP